MSPDGFQYEVAGKVSKKILHHFIGLSAITMTASYRNIDDQHVAGIKVQEFKIEGATHASRPDITDEEIGQILYYRANQFIAELLLNEAIKPGGKVTFVVYFFSRNHPDHSKTYNQTQVSIPMMAIKEDLLLGDEDEEEEEEGDEDEEGEEGEDEEEESEEGEDEEEGEEGEGEEEDEEDTAKQAKATKQRRLSRMRSVGLPRVASDVRVIDAGFEDDLDEAQRIVAQWPEEDDQPPRRRSKMSRDRELDRERVMLSRMPASFQRPSMSRGPNMHGPSMHGRGAELYGGRLSNSNESDMVSIVRQLVQLSVDQGQAFMARDAHFFAEMRAGMETMTSQYRLMMSDMRSEVSSARTQANQAHGRLYDIVNMQGSYLENQNKANQQGWAAFQAGMQMSMAAVENKNAYQQQHHELQMSQMAYAHGVELERERERATGSTISQAPTKDPKRSLFIREVVAPIAVAITGSILASKGQDAAAKLLTDTASAYFGGDAGEEDQEPEVEEDDDLPPPPRGRKASAEPDPNSPNPPVHLVEYPKGWVKDRSNSEETVAAVKRLFDEMPIVASLRTLHAWLTTAQRKQMAEILGESTWAALVAASKADKDAAALFKLMPLAARLKEDGVRERVEAVLGKHQRDLLGSLLVQIQASLGGGKKTVVETTAKTKKEN